MSTNIIESKWPEIKWNLAWLKQENIISNAMMTKRQKWLRIKLKRSWWVWGKKITLVGEARLTTSNVTKEENERKKGEKRKGKKRWENNKDKNQTLESNSWAKGLATHYM